MTRSGSGRSQGLPPMNWALENASGEWLAPLDDDDEFTPDHVEVLLDAARETASEFVYGVAEAEGALGEWARIGAWPLKHGEIVHASVLYSTALRFFRHNERSWRLGEPGDWNLWKRMKKSGVRMAFVDRVVVRHYAERRYAGSDDGTPAGGSQLMQGYHGQFGA